MPVREEELVQRLMKEHMEFFEAKQAHSQLAKELEELEKKPFITPQDELDIKVLKKRKLALKDQMERILMKHR